MLKRIFFIELHGRSELQNTFGNSNWPGTGFYTASSSGNLINLLILHLFNTYDGGDHFWNSRRSSTDLTSPCVWDFSCNVVAIWISIGFEGTGKSVQNLYDFCFSSEWWAKNLYGWYRLDFRMRLRFTHVPVIVLYILCAAFGPAVLRISEAIDAFTQTHNTHLIIWYCQCEELKCGTKKRHTLTQYPYMNRIRTHINTSGLLTTTC